MRSPFSAALLLCLLAVFCLAPIATIDALAQDSLNPLNGRRLTRYPPMEEAFAKGGESWKEDIRKVTEGLEHQLTPEQYRAGLRSTGMQDYLDQALRTADTNGDFWTLRGPIGGTSAEPRNGRIAGIQIINPTNSSATVFVGSCQGGLWKAKSSDADGGVWENLGTVLPNPSVRAFAVDPDSDQHIVVGTGDHSRYTGAGIFETYDGGDSWYPRTTPFEAKYYYRMIFQGRTSSPANQYLITASSSGLFRSEDGGNTWALAQYADGSMTDGSWTDLLEHPTNPAVLYACVGRYHATGLSGIYKSTDYGETWTQQPDISLPQSGYWGRASLAICKYAPYTLAVLVSGPGGFQGVFKSTDNGTNWSIITNELVGFGGDQIVHAQAIAIRPDNPDHIFVGSVGLAMTTNGGASWAIGAETGINWGYSDITQLYFSDAISEDVLWICNDGGIYYHDFIGGGDYSFIGGTVTGLACSEIDNMDADRNWRVIGLQDNGVFFSEDSGNVWLDESNGDGADVEIYDPVDGDYMYNTGVFPEPEWRTFRKPNNSGAVYLPSPYPIYTPRLQHSPDLGIMATNDEKSIYTLNSETGTTWLRIATDLQPEEYLIRDLTCSLAGDQTFYVTYWDSHPRDVTVVRNIPGQGYVISHAKNLGTTDQRLIDVVPSREWPGEIWVTLTGDPGQPKILHTTDYGVNWTDISSNLADVDIVETLEVQPFNPLILYAGTGLGMFRSINGGQSWDPYQDGLPIGRCKELRFVIDAFGSNHTLELAMDGRGLWSHPMTLPQVVFVDQESTLAAAGTREHPHHSIQDALQNAPSGAIIAVRSGTYNEPYPMQGDHVVVTWGGPTVVR